MLIGWFVCDFLLFFCWFWVEIPVWSHYESLSVIISWFSSVLLLFGCYLRQALSVLLYLLSIKLFIALCLLLDRSFYSCFFLWFCC
jgi:hypothetical protein